jgi:hypothetical protein
MSAPILLRALLLQGPTGEYEVRFDGEGEILPVSVVGGPMRTGKTSLFSFIDWCLGDSEHPDHPQFADLTTALLEIDFRGERQVIARRLFDESSAVQIHRCSLAEISKPHAVSKHPVSLPSDPESLSALLVEACGLSGSKMRRRPSAADSETTALSYRNLSWLSYLPSRRLEDHVLLHEDRPQDKMHQHRQMLDIVFDVADENLSQATARLNAAKARVKALESQISAVEKFLGDQLTPRSEIQSAMKEQEDQTSGLASRLAAIDETIRAEDSYPQELRAELADSSEQARALSIKLRDRQTLLARLAPLRHQYAEELKKLNFVQEARRVLDPIPVTRCPVCTSALVSPGVQHGVCDLCGQEPEPAQEGEAIDISSEIRSVQSRLRELIAYIREVDEEADAIGRELEAAREAEVGAQRALDQAARQAVTPFLSERDQITSALLDARTQLSQLQALSVQRSALDDLFLNLKQAQDDVVARKEEAERLQAEQPSRDSVITELGLRFESIMREVGFPGLESAAVADTYAPIINQRHYSAETSSGAQTLISVCWQLAVYELLVEQGRSHPGHLMIDSIQKGMAQQSTPGIDDRFSDPAIVDRLYSHIRSWAGARLGEVQVIIVDQSIPNDHRDLLVIEFTRDPHNPPAGLIHDAAEVGAADSDQLDSGV